MRSLHRRMIKAFQHNLPGATVELVSEKRHPVFEVTYQGVTRKVATSASPRDEHYALLNACRDVCRMFGTEFGGVR